jgi:RHS repeat-associated protein
VRGTPDQPITWVFEPESFAPAAKLVGSQQFAIITDHLGTPTAMLDADGRTIWSADIGIYGELRHVVGDKQACPFRWPGQYEDEETGLYYNRFRYYDPDAGEYVSQDPIRVEGDNATLYSYVEDPLFDQDPWGLAKACGVRNPKVRKAARTGQEAHRQIEAKLRKKGYKTEVPLTLKGGKQVRKDAMKGKEVIIIKPDTPSGRLAAQKRADLMKKNGYKPKPVFYDPANPAYLPGSRSYIGPS